MASTCICAVVRRWPSSAKSGSGKSVTCLSLMGLIQSPGRIAAGNILLRSRSGKVLDLASLDDAAMRTIRGNEIAMIFQEPMTSLNPLYTVGDQIAEAVEEHQAKAAARRARSPMPFSDVGIADPERRAADYPHQMSGGMRQRVMIAMALACRPSAHRRRAHHGARCDDPGPDPRPVARPAQRGGGGMSIIFVTHNMGVVAEMADRTAVMYAGKVVETGPVRDIFRNPRHPYTRGLLGSIAKSMRGPNGVRLPLPAIPGNVPNPLDLPPGCAFAPRCAHALPACAAATPPLEEVNPGHATRCIRWREL